MELQAITKYLTPELVLAAYRRGIFPMSEPELGLITWHKPDPRAIIPLDGLHIPRSMAKLLRRKTYEVTIDRDFVNVMHGCATREPTWISPEFIKVYTELHQRGLAHSIEVWRDGELAGGLYGVNLGGAFFAESKFHYLPNASKVALIYLAQHMQARGLTLLEVQYVTEHLKQFGTIEISDREYQMRLEAALKQPSNF